MEGKEESVWERAKGVWTSMADRLDDIICSFDAGSESSMDILTVLFLGWIIFAGAVYFIGSFIYDRYVKVNKDDKSGKIRVEGQVTKVDSGSPHEPVLTPKDAASIHSYAPIKEAPIVANRAGGVSSEYSGFPTPGSQENIPVATGPDIESVQWVSNVFRWLFNHRPLSQSQDILDTWTNTINEFCKKAGQESGVTVEVVKLHHDQTAPHFSNLFADCGPSDNITVTCDCQTKMVMTVRAVRRRGDKPVSTDYLVTVDRLRGRLNIACITEELMAVVKFDGWPEVVLSVDPVAGSGGSGGLDEQQTQDIVSEMVSSALRNVVVDLNMNKYPKFPRFVRSQGVVEPMLSASYNGMLQSSPAGIPVNKRLLVKIIKASSLGADKGCLEPYCVVEMDDPPQKHQTAMKKETTSPFWDEHFLFDLSPNTAEILFEIFDKSKRPLSNFLGLGIVGIEELLMNPSQRQIIPLQSRPYENDEVSGSLTVEFLFMEGTDIPGNLESLSPNKRVETKQRVSPSGALITTTHTTITKPQNDVFVNGGDSVTDTALKELEQKNKGAAVVPNKSTLIIHSSKKHDDMPEMNHEPPSLSSNHAPQEAIRSIVKVERNRSGVWREVSFKAPDIGDAPRVADDAVEGSVGSDASSKDDGDRGRGRRKRKDFFGSLRRRLNRSKNRSKSVEPSGDTIDESLDRDEAAARSASLDRGQYLTLPPNKGPATSGKNVDESSLSEASGISNASTRTYVNEASTLVLETVENGVKKHYLIPLTLAQKSKWKKKGIKLHIYNDHMFVAKHLPSSTLCQICAKSLPRRIGKQGYECRDCQLKCHKPCHVRVEEHCPKSTVHTMELEYAKDPKEEKKSKQSS